METATCLRVLRRPSWLPRRDCPSSVTVEIAPAAGLVFDTSPLQALHRAGALPNLRAAVERVLIPQAVRNETVASLPLSPPGRVPNLDEFPWIGVEHVGADDIASAGAVLAGSRRAVEVYRWFNRTIDRPEVEALVLARRVSGRAVMEDRNGVKCALDFGVPAIGVADLLVELERAGHLVDAQASAKTILETGYYSRQLWWLSQGLRTW